MLLIAARAATQYPAISCVIITKNVKGLGLGLCAFADAKIQKNPDKYKGKPLKIKGLEKFRWCLNR